MKLIIRGKPKKALLQEVRFATKWFAERTLCPRVLDEGKITLKFANLDWSGQCIPKDDPITPVEFDIEVNMYLNRLLTLKTIAHEIAHVKQFSEGNLHFASDGKHAVWKRKKFKYQGKNYYDWPWEIEANGIEYGKIAQYQQFLAENKGQLKWYSQIRQRKKDCSKNVLVHSSCGNSTLVTKNS